MEEAPPSYSEAYAAVDEVNDLEWGRFETGDIGCGPGSYYLDDPAISVIREDILTVEDCLRIIDEISREDPDNPVVIWQLLTSADGLPQQFQYHRRKFLYQNLDAMSNQRPEEFCLQVSEYQKSLKQTQFYRKDESAGQMGQWAKYLDGTLGSPSAVDFTLVSDSQWGRFECGDIGCGPGSYYDDDPTISLTRQDVFKVEDCLRIIDEISLEEPDNPVVMWQLLTTEDGLPQQFKYHRRKFLYQDLDAMSNEPPEEFCRQVSEYQKSIKQIQFYKKNEPAGQLGQWDSFTKGTLGSLSPVDFTLVSDREWGRFECGDIYCGPGSYYDDDPTITVTRRDVFSIEDCLRIIDEVSREDPDNPIVIWQLLTTEDGLPQQFQYHRRKFLYQSMDAMSSKPPEAFCQSVSEYQKNIKQIQFYKRDEPAGVEGEWDSHKSSKDRVSPAPLPGQSQSSPSPNTEQKSPSVAPMVVDNTVWGCFFKGDIANGEGSKYFDPDITYTREDVTTIEQCMSVIAAVQSESPHNPIVIFQLGGGESGLNCMRYHRRQFLTKIGAASARQACSEMSRLTDDKQTLYYLINEETVLAVSNSSCCIIT